MGLLGRWLRKGSSSPWDACCRCGGVAHVTPTQGPWDLCMSLDILFFFLTFKNSLFQNNYGFTGNFKDTTERAREPFTVCPMSTSSITTVQYQTQEICVDKICMYNSVPFYHMYRFMYSRRPPLPWFYFPGFQLPAVNLRKLRHPFSQPSVSWVLAFRQHGGEVGFYRRIRIVFPPSFSFL